MKRNAKITISVLIMFIGFCLLASTYFNTKKHEVFDDMNKQYYEQTVYLNENIDDVEEAKPVEDVYEENSNTVINIPIIPETTTQTTTEAVKNNKYIGYLKIPSISLNRGLVAKDSKYNNVNKNIYMHPLSDYPDVKNGNLILASHSGTSSISYFKNLYKLNVNDDIYVEYNGKEYHYQIKRIYTGKKDGTVAIRRNYDATTLTLITCTKNDKTTQTVYICELV